MPLPFSTSAIVFRQLRYEVGSDTSFSAVVSLGHCRLATPPAPWRHGAPLLSHGAGPSGFPVSPKKFGHCRPQSELCDLNHRLAESTELGNFPCGSFGMVGRTAHKSKQLLTRFLPLEICTFGQTIVHTKNR